MKIIIDKIKPRWKNREIDRNDLSLFIENVCWLWIGCTYNYLFYFKEKAVSLPTISEEMFEQLCTNKGIEFSRITEGPVKSADYLVSSNELSMVVEI